MYPVEYHDEGNNWEVDGLPYELNENEYVGMLYFEGDDQHQFPYTPGGAQPNYFDDYTGGGYMNYGSGESPLKSPSRLMPRYVWEDECSPNGCYPSGDGMDLLDGGFIIPTNDRQQELFVQNIQEEVQDIPDIQDVQEEVPEIPIPGDDVLQILDEGQIDNRTDALIDITDGDVNDFFITKEPLFKMKKTQPRLPTGTSTWVDPKTNTYICMWTDCGLRDIGTKEHLSDHIKVHLQTYTGQQGYPFGKDKEEFKCPVHGCCFSSILKGAVENHIFMHLHHAARQMEALAYMKKSDDLKRIESCGFRPILHLSFEGMEMNCSWEYCDKAFEDVNNFYAHLAEHVNHSDRGDRVFNRYHCGWFGCSKEFDHRGDLRKHACRHVNMKKCACPFCGAFMNSWEKLSIHLKRRGEKQGEFECLKCAKRFTTEAILNNHIRAHLYSTKCEPCDTLFRSNYELERHNQLKHKMLPKVMKIWRCDFESCGQIFDTWNKLTAHKVEHNIAQFACKFCPCKFIYQLQLNRHKMKFHPESMKKPDAYECHICMKTMNTAAKLSYHLRKTHRFIPPKGFSRFTYQKCSDQVYRVCTVKMTRQSLEEEE